MKQVSGESNLTLSETVVFLPGYSDHTSDIDGIRTALEDEFENVHVFISWELSRFNLLHPIRARRRRRELARVAVGAEILGHSLGNNWMKRCVGAAAYNICHGANAPHAPMPMNPWKLKQGTDAEAEQLKAISERQEDLSDREVDIQRHVEDVDQRSKESNLSLADKFKQWIQFPRMAMTNRIKLAQELQEAGATVTIAASRDDAYFPLTDEEIAKAAELQIPLIEMAGAHSELAWRPVAYIKEFLRLRGQKLHPDK